MATLFWVGGTGTFDGVTNHFATTSGGIASVANPTSSDTVTFDTLSNALAYTCTISATLNCSDLTIGNPLAGVITVAGASAINCFGNFSAPSGGTWTYSGAITFSAIATGKTITCNSVTLINAITFNGIGGGWTLQDNLTTTNQTITLTNGSLDTNSKNVSCASFASNSNNTRTLTLGTSSFTCTTVSGFSINSSTGLIFSGASSTIICSGCQTFTAPSTGLTFGTVTLTLNSSCTITGANTYTNLTLNGTSTITSNFSLANNQTISTLFTIIGNSTINRVLIQSNILGTTRTITSASNTISNADFQDITGAGAGSWNLSAISGLSGDCGGNSGITFTTPADQHWLNASSSSWSTAANWTSRIPLPQDNVFMDKAFGTSQTITANMPRLGASIDWTGATWTTALTWQRSTVGTVSIFGSLKLISGLTLSSFAVNFQGRGSYNLTSFGVIFDSTITLNAANGTITLVDPLVGSSVSQLAISLGTFNDGNQNISVGTCFSNTGNTRTITMGTSNTWTISGISGGSSWFMASGTLILNSNTSTIKITDSTNNASGFTGGGKTYYNLWFARGASTASNIIASSNTFSDFKDDGTALHSILFTAATNQTFTTFSVSGNNSASGNQITLNSTTTGTYTFTKAGGGIISSDYLNIQHCVAGPGNWYAGKNSTNNQGTATAGSGWIFDIPPIPNQFTKVPPTQAVNRSVTF